MAQGLPHAQSGPDVNGYMSEPGQSKAGDLNYSEGQREEGGVVEEVVERLWK
jgi:hypothetical protein